LLSDLLKISQQKVDVCGCVVCEVIAWRMSDVWSLSVYVVICAAFAGRREPVVDAIEDEDEGRVWEVSRQAFVGPPKTVFLPTVLLYQPS